MSIHCWHVVPGFAYANGAHQYVCCCGTLANGSAGYREERLDGHGPHAPLVRRSFVDEPLPAACPARVAPGGGA